MYRRFTTIAFTGFAYFTPKLPLISHQPCHPFQGKAATDFTPILPPS